MRTRVMPLELFGCTVPGMFAVVAGRTPVALVKREGQRKLNVLSVQDRHGGKAGEFGMKAHEVLSQIRQVMPWEDRRREVLAEKPHKPCKTCRLLRQPCVWYWVGGRLCGHWRRSDAGTRADAIKLGYYAIDGDERREPRQTPPEEWFENYHRPSYREAFATMS